MAAPLALNIFTDLIIAIIPASTILKIQTTFRKRMGLILFGAIAFIMVATILRVVMVLVRSGLPPAKSTKTVAILAILASAAIAAVGKIAAESVNDSQAEALGNTRSYGGLLGRSILAESVLQCYLESPSKQQETFTDFLAPLVAAIKPAVLKVAPLDTQDKREARPHPAEINTRIGRQLTENENTFLDGLIEVADDTVVKSFCSALTTIGDVFGSAFKKAGPVLADVATIGLLLLLKAFHLAEACLQAYIAVPDSDLRKSRVYRKIDAQVKV
ncbi:hypothetical protein F4801DRAFT_578693 [Xylaria longipes]|nr:hypothetical protein F4801DRAFT_578693 [Xylaria longipes]